MAWTCDIVTLSRTTTNTPHAFTIPGLSILHPHHTIVIALAINTLYRTTIHTHTLLTVN